MVSSLIPNLEVVDYAGPEYAVLYAYPSPGIGKSITVEIKGLHHETQGMNVEIIGPRGYIVWRGRIPATSEGTAKEEIVFSSPLAPGLYIMRAGATLALTRKIVIK